MAVIQYSDLHCRPEITVDTKIPDSAQCILHNYTYLVNDVDQATQDEVAFPDKKKAIDETMASAASVVSDLDVVLKHLRCNEDNGETGSSPRLSVSRESQHSSSSP